MARATVFASLSALALFSAGCASLASGRPIEDSIIYQPRPYPQGNWTLDPGFENAWFESADGCRLHGLFAEASDPRQVVLYMHGNAGNVTDLGPVLRLFRDRLNTSVLVFDYRGYGRSEGTPSEAGVLADARAARAWLAKRTRVGEQDIVLVGYSLGGAVAVDLAAKDGARGLVLDRTFTSVPEAAASRFPLLPVRHLVRARFDSLAKISDYRGPLLQVHGDADQVIPFELGLKLFREANAPKKFVKVPGGAHGDPPSREFVEELDRFLTSLPRRK